MRKVVDIELLKARLSEVCGQSDGDLMDKAMDYILHEYIPKLVDELAEEIEDTATENTTTEDSIINKIKQLDYEIKFDMKVHNKWRTYKITKSELCEDELDVVCITDDNIVYDIGYVDMKDVKESFIEDYKEGIIEDIKLEG